MKRILILIIVLLGTQLGQAQELNCQVSIQANPALDVTTTEKEIFKEIEEAIFDLVNETAWTKDKFEVEERINCNLQMSIVEINGNSFKATMQVQATRPVFNTTYNTTLINFLDEDVYFTFRRGAKLIYSDNQFTENLTAIIAFYANYILGLDGDSFAVKGGNPYFVKAQNIVSLAQASMSPGWKSDDRGRKNRFWLIDNTLHELFNPLRECFYDYHRKGLDKMYDNPSLARDEIKAALDKLITVNSSRPNSINVATFVRGKRDELIGIYREAEKKQQTEVVNTLKRIDPTNSTKYQEIIQ